MLYLRKEEFINMRDITLVIARLLYYIRGIVFMELMKRNDRNEDDLCVDNLDGLGMYVRDLVQSSFDFLRKTMHLVAATYLSQICWLGNEEYTSLAIRGKRVELKELRDLCGALLKKAEIQLHNRASRPPNMDDGKILARRMIWQTLNAILDKQASYSSRIVSISYA